MYYEHAIQNCTRLAIEFLKTIVPSSANDMTALQQDIEATILNGPVAKPTEAEIDRLEALQGNLRALYVYICQRIKPETQTLIESSIVRTALEEIEEWRDTVGCAIVYLKTELELALAN